MMKHMMRNALAALSIGMMTVTAMPADAKPDHGRDDRHGNGHGRDDDRHGGKHWDKRGGGHGPDRRYAHGRDRGRDWHRDGDRNWDRRDFERRDRHYRRPVYGYDWNRPDPRYRGYYADRYYRGGYDPIRVTRHTRIYRGYDDRYYCRRSDGTTGLIVGATLGALLGNELGRGQSNLAATLMGGGVGALLGREIDRGDLVCR